MRPRKARKCGYEADIGSEAMESPVKQQLNSKLSQDREHYKMTTSPSTTTCYCYGEGGANGVRTDTSAHLPSTGMLHDTEDTVALARPSQCLRAWLSRDLKPQRVKWTPTVPM